MLLLAASSRDTRATSTLLLSDGFPMAHPPRLLQSRQDRPSLRPEGYTPASNELKPLTLAWVPLGTRFPGTEIQTQRDKHIGMAKEVVPSYHLRFHPKELRIITFLLFFWN